MVRVDDFEIATEAVAKERALMWNFRVVKKGEDVAVYYAYYNSDGELKALSETRRPQLLKILNRCERRSLG
jgi:hypothetical protein